jgi:virulence factor Mce-like protein
MSAVWARRAGAFAVAGAAVVGAWSWLPVGEDPTRVVVELEDTAGLFVGNDVGILGVKVGEVRAITPRGAVVEVELELDDDREVPASVGAVVVSRSVATDRYVELVGAFEDGPPLADGDRIPLERTHTPVEFDEVLASLDELTRGLGGTDGEAAGLQALLAAGATALDGRGADANRTVRLLARAAAGLGRHQDDLVGSIEGLDGLTALLAANEEVVDQLATSAADATDLLADESENFGTALTSMSEALSSLAAFVRDNRGALRGSVRGLTRVTENLLVHQSELIEAVEVSPLLFENIGNAIGDDDRLDVKMPLRYLLPGAELVDVLCDDVLPAGTCDALGTSPDLEGLLEALLGEEP